MKIPLLAILSLITFQCGAQNYDSLRRVINDMRIEYNEVDMRLQRSHEQYSTGTIVLGIGLGAAIIGGVLFGLQPDDPGPMASGLMIAGGAAAITGGIIQIDSHKWLSRRWRRK